MGQGFRDNWEKFVPSSRSAKEICREDPKSISCSVATKREARKKRRDEEYGTEAPKPTETPKQKKPTKPATERRKYLDERIREAEGGPPANKS